MLKAFTAGIPYIKSEYSAYWIAIRVVIHGGGRQVGKDHIVHRARVNPAVAICCCPTHVLSCVCCGVANFGGGEAVG